VDYQVEGEPEPRRLTEAPVAISQSVSQDYFQTLGISLMVGRYLNENDKAESPPVVIVDDTFVGRHFSSIPINQVIGKRLRFGGEGEPWREIVGVVNHVRQDGIEEEGRAGIYQPWLQMNPSWLANMSRAMDMIVKTSSDPETLVGPIRGVVRNVDRDQPIANVRTLRSIVDERLAPRKFTLSVLSIFAFLACVLGAIGLYGVMAYHVTQRTREVGIRMALGAQRANVMRLILKQGMTLVVVALANWTCWLMDVNALDEEPLVRSECDRCHRIFTATRVADRGRTPGVFRSSETCNESRPASGTTRFVIFQAYRTYRTYMTYTTDH
jgi:putative ABC transport system permease protein